MRGLDTRVLLANTRIMMYFDSVKAASMMNTVEKQAEQDGWADAENGIHTPPLMFDGEAELTVCWELGQARFTVGFNKKLWRMQCEHMARLANEGCGLSYDYYVSRLSTAVDNALSMIPGRDQFAALEIAHEYGYATPSEREEIARSNAEDGYCNHGIELGCCPAGCDFPDELDDTLDYRADLDPDDADEQLEDIIEGRQ